MSWVRDPRCIRERMDKHSIVQVLKIPFPGGCGESAPRDLTWSDANATLPWYSTAKRVGSCPSPRPRSRPSNKDHPVTLHRPFLQLGLANHRISSSASSSSCGLSLVYPNPSSTRRASKKIIFVSLRRQRKG